MDSQNSVIAFVEEEANLAGQERLAVSNDKLIQELVEKSKAINDENGDKKGALDFVEKNLPSLISIAPHLALQIYLNLLAVSGLQYELVDKMTSLLSREDIPAKAYGLIQRYVSIFKQKETVSPQEVSSDKNIIEAIDSCDIRRIPRVLFYIELRLKTDSNMDYMIDLISPFMASNKDSLFKISLLRQLVTLATRYPATKPLTMTFKNRSYTITLNGKFKDNEDPFLMTVNYFLSICKDKFIEDKNVRELILSLSIIYRVLHLNEEKVLNNEVDLKSFCYCIASAYYHNLGDNPYLYMEYPSSYKSAKGWKEADDFLHDVYFTTGY